MSTETKVDIGFVRKVLEFVENEHSDFKHEQGTFFMTPEIAHRAAMGGKVYLYDGEMMESFSQRFGSGCQTAACIAGTACLLDPDTEFDSCGNPQFDGHEVHWSDHAANLLGMDGLTANRIFWEMNETRAIGMLRDHLEQLENRELL